MLLGIDTSTRTAALALFDEEKGIVAESRFGLSLAHSETLMPHVADLLESTDLDARDLGGIAVARGPGSFTGLRVALATVKGLAFSMGTPVYPVSTLEAMAFPLTYASLLVCPVLDARKNEVYAALYRPQEGTMEIVLAECALAPGELLNFIDEPVLFLGDGAVRHRPLILGQLGTRAHFSPAAIFQPSAVSVCELALRQYLRAGVPPPNPVSITPTYLRPSEAEVKWKERHRE